MVMASPRSGVSLKPQHYGTIIGERPDVGFFEIHAENYMGAGGPPHRYLSAVAEDYPLSIHGVGLSIGGASALDKLHLARLSVLVDRYAPALFSEHLAWSTHGGSYLNDLFPVPYTAEALECVVNHMDEVQTALKRQILLENPSTYLSYRESTYSEVDFITEVVKRSGCALLLDLTNVWIGCTNRGTDPCEYVDNLPASAVREIHLAGFTSEKDELGRPLLIDTHDQAVDPSVWRLFRQAIGRTGPVPTMIEWDANIPPFTELKAQADHAESWLLAIEPPEVRHATA